MENIELILSIATAGIGLLITTVTFIMKFIQSVKAKKNAEDLITVGNALLGFIAEAEEFLSYSGKEKKAYVLTKANQFALANKIPFDAVAVSERIEELIELTQSVNATKADKTEEKPCRIF